MLNSALFLPVIVRSTDYGLGGTQHVNFHLSFRGDQANELPKLLIAILVENAHRCPHLLIPFFFTRDFYDEVSKLK